MRGTARARPTAAGATADRARSSARRGTTAPDRRPARTRPTAAASGRPTASTTHASRFDRELHDVEQLVDRRAASDRTSGTARSVSSTVSFSASCVSCSWMPSRGAQRARVAVPALAEHLDLAGIGGEQPFEDLDRGGLAGAVRAEQAEALAAKHLQVEAVDGDHGSVALRRRRTQLQRRPSVRRTHARL